MSVRELMRRLLDWADNWAGLLRIELGVFSDNARAIALYRKFGFELEGTQRAWALREGVFIGLADDGAPASEPAAPAGVRDACLIIASRRRTAL